MKAIVTYKNSLTQEIPFIRVHAPVTEEDLMILETENGFRTISKDRIQEVIIQLQ